MSRIAHKTVTIALDAKISDEIETYGDLLAGIYLPAALDGTLKVTAEHPLSGDFVAFKDVTFSANQYVPFNPDDTAGLTAFRLETSASQTAARTFVLAIVQ